MKKKGILIVKIASLGLIIASFFILEDPLVRKCRKAELVVSGLPENGMASEETDSCYQMLQKAKTLIQISQTLECQLKTMKKTQSETDITATRAIRQRMKSLRAEAESLLDEIILKSIMKEQLAGVRNQESGESNLVRLPEIRGK